VLETPEVASMAVSVIVTGVVYHPLLPTVPDRVDEVTGAVVSILID
jgi:hypothetical protein